MIYRVWDTDINRLHGTYDTEEDALALVRTLVTAYGDDYAEDLAVGGERPEGTFTEPLSGADLLAYAERVAAERERVGHRRLEVIASHGYSGGGGYSEPSEAIAAKGMSCSTNRRSSRIVAANRSKRQPMQ